MTRHVRVLEDPAAEPVSLDEAKLWCRVDSSTEDAIIELLISAARERAEDYTGRAFVQRRLELRLDAFPKSDEPIEIPFAPLISVEYLTYSTNDGDVTILGSPTAWITDTGSIPGRIAPLYGESWPTARETLGSVRIGYTCGYAPVGSPTDEEALRAAVPANVKLWMQARLATMYEYREQLMMNNTVKVPRDFVDGLLDGLRVNTQFA